MWVRCNNRRGDVVVRHGYRCHRTGGVTCDLPQWPVDKHHLDTGCHYRPAIALWERIYRGSYMAPPSRQPYRRAWFAAERAAQRRIARSLIRDANSGDGEVDEDVIDHRKAGRYRLYGGGWWD
ncbi:hypothetical protein MMAG44476_38055 [Mycolicibacterium mageritense DSM 44476 = CIP 104973]|uniref:HNH endonuclease n=2 Tax=Mycolicibacterium mageritense TaxID=53462 RepID=A0ABM8HLH9_MYCME|nr:hypothetical protein MMAGJ_73140 [Mycolicibacterium mageritense]CDO25302.1 hypothetical protein BN978_05807 [Mycolicibacterium mageritense DSM 44476 = CIP 104973]